jgi:hypothetical protein
MANRPSRDAPGLSRLQGTASRSTRTIVLKSLEPLCFSGYAGAIHENEGHILRHWRNPH